MKVYISVDIEGCAGVTHWDETKKEHRDYPEFREQMTREAIAAIEGAKIAGATEILVKDAHETGRNLITSMLPADIRLVRSWQGHPLCMVQELDESFDAVLMIGYHSAAGSEANALAHTLSRDAAEIRINGHRASEFYIHALASSMLGVPTIFVSGDKGLMEEVELVNPHVGRCAVKEGRGQATVTMTPAAACKAIREGVTRALRADRRAALLAAPEHLVVEITYADPVLAARHQYYPGMTHVGNRTIRFETNHYFEVLRMLNYAT